MSINYKITRNSLLLLQMVVILLLEITPQLLRSKKGTEVHPNAYQYDYTFLYEKGSNQTLQTEVQVRRTNYLLCPCFLNHFILDQQ